MLTILIIVLGYFALRFCWHLTRPVALIEPPAPINVFVVHLHYHEAERGR
jgi:hypothetical protein